MNKTIFLLFVFFLCSNISASIIVMDSNSGRVIYNHNGDEVKLIASTTKIMSAIVAIENGNLSDIYKVGNEITKVNGSMIYLKEHEKISLNDLLYGLLLQSGNDASMVIANNVLGYEKFITQMNRKAQSIGMKNTTFENPHGLNDDTKNYSTAHDLALLMKYALNNKTFVKISSTKRYKTKTNLNEYIWYNKNRLLSTYKYTTSGKIGYTKASGQVFVSSATKDNKKLIIVSIDENDKFNLHENLYEKYFNIYENYKVIDEYTFSLNDKRYNNYYMYVSKDINLLLKDNEKDKLRIIAKINNKLRNNIAGSLNFYIEDKLLYKQTLYYEEYKTRINKIKSLLFRK